MHRQLQQYARQRDEHAARQFIDRINFYNYTADMFLWVDETSKDSMDLGGCRSVVASCTQASVKSLSRCDVILIAQRRGDFRRRPPKDCVPVLYSIVRGNNN